MQQNIVTSHLLEWLLSNRLETTNVGEDVKKRTLVCYWWECKLVLSLWESV